jgi:hypothetical protein
MIRDDVKCFTTVPFTVNTRSVLEFTFILYGLEKKYLKISLLFV